MNAIPIWFAEVVSIAATALEVDCDE